MDIFNRLIFLVIVFLNAFVDLGHKIVLQNTAFKVLDGNEQVILVSIINAMIVIPFILLFSPSGHLSDRFDKEKIIKYSSLGAVFISGGMIVSYMYGAFYVSIGLLFLLAVQSAIYSPAKFGYIKQLYGKDKLAQGNGKVQATSIIAILSGMFVFSILFENIFAGLLFDGLSVSEQTSLILTSMISLSVILFFVSLLEFLLTFRLPSYNVEKKEELFKPSGYFTGKYIANNIKMIKSKEGIFLSIMGLTVFWAIAQGMIAVFPAYAKEYAGITSVNVVNGIIAISSIGIALGSYFYSRISKHYIELGTIPLASIGISICLYLTTQTINETYYFILFFMFGFFGGLLIVPLNSLIQFNSNEKELGSVLAGNNWFQSLGMISILIVSALFASMSIDSKYILESFIVISVLGTIYTVYKLPQSIIRFLISRIFQLRYSFDVHKLHNLPSEGGVLLLGNHISWLDWAVLQMASPRPIKFIMERNIYEKWYLKRILDIFKVVPISSAGSKQALDDVAKELDAGHLVCIFPEGAISRNGHLGEFKKGAEKILEKTQTDVKVVPFFIKGLWGTVFSRANENYIKKVNRHYETSVTFGKPMCKISSMIDVKQEVLDLSVYAYDKHITAMNSIPERIVQRAKLMDNDLLIADSTGLELSGAKTLALSITLRNVLESKLGGRYDEKNIGLVLPSTAIGYTTSIALLMLGRTLVNLNYTSSVEALKGSAEKAELKTIITSKQFMKKLKAKNFDIAPLLENRNVIFLEDLKSELTKTTVIKNLIKVKLLSTDRLIKMYVEKTWIEDTATILFSSGSEGTPKGIELSHKNILGNVEQISTILDARDNDVMVGNLPLFHSFGLTVNMFLPLIEGMPVVAHPDATDGFGLAKLISKYQATILCGTSTFFRLYVGNRKINPLMFDSLRMVIAGAEKLDDKVRLKFKEKFGKDILEGYGATETTPVATCNIPDRLTPDYKMQVGNKIGSVGLPLVGTAIKIIEPSEIERYKKEYDKYSDEITDDVIAGHQYELLDVLDNMPLTTLANGEEGMICIGGVQVMKGYLGDKEKTDETTFNHGGKTWYITGDKGRLDADGFLTIVDRYSRFAKLGGEMISLTAVENAISDVVTDSAIECIAVNLPDVKKGEKIALMLSGVEEADLSDFKTQLNAIENKMMIPSEYHIVEAIPKLGTGKKDFKEAKKMLS